ncbi:hypothetical protein K2F43_17025 [Clostridium estertheticum]|uniref:hypothetical protein n=1 Tax=Clostridium estertheticum TaxID=238834 RepID=UPI001C6E5FA7|nr:hypothetical protein [Clostridium estertheticum]MBW9172911.1 hypothetical protein [Clostridium estertheticum]WLC75249.1 hypothetical protein KTC99_21475 [Clostridium estertheticum]
MLEEEVITIGNVVQNDATVTVNIEDFQDTTSEDGVVTINFNKKENENKVAEELTTLILQEEKNLTGGNITKIQELLNKLPVEEKRVEMTYRKDELIKSLKAKNLTQELENSINSGNNIEKIESIFSLMNKYEQISKLKRNCSLEKIENSLISIHKDNFEELLNNGKYSLESIDDNIEKYEELKKNIEMLQKNIRFVINISLKDVIVDEIKALNDKKNSIDSKLMELLNCDEESLELAVKSQLLINTINSGNSSEEIDNAIIENNYIDYINLGQKRRKKALEMFIEKKNKNYISITDVKRDLNFIVSVLKKESTTTDTIKL